MRETLDFLIEHGYTVLFAWVLAEQLGLPIPSLPLLFAAGALAGAGKLSFFTAVGLAVLASLIADMLWYELGRVRGGKILGLLCRISLEPDSCVRRAEEAFQNHSTRSLLFAKFIPGLNAASSPMAGMTGMRLPRFVLLDAAGALLYAASAVLVGYLFSEKLEDLAFYLSRLGNVAVVLAVLAFAAHIFRKYMARRRFQRELWMARVTPEELKSKIDAGEPPAIVDLRHPLDFLAYPQVIPGAIRMAPKDIEQRHSVIPRDREIILYCT
jgi:membrane protein DedA with SNARE-associated domain